MVHRLLNLDISSSFFLFGPRGVGKSTLLADKFKKANCLWIDLLDAEQEERLEREPKSLENEIRALSKKVKWVVIDEIQKLPRLLDVVHRLIEDRSVKVRFALTGSSARKLKRGGANLLAGRAYVFELHPFTHRELGKKFSLESALRWGNLPRITSIRGDSSKRNFLESYARTYLKEEVWGEQLIRELNPFRRFLEIAAQANGQLINYSNIARDVGVDTKTVQNYFQILEDTLLGFMLEPFHRSVRKRQRSAPKFYFFDTGVKRALELTSGLPLVPASYGYGAAFEHFVVLECHRLNSYLKKNYRFSYLRTKDDVEVDLVIERPGKSLALVEIKSTENISERDAKHIELIGASLKTAERFILSRDKRRKLFGKTMALPWAEGLKALGL